MPAFPPSGLAALNRALIGKAEAVDSGWRTILDMDSTEVPVYGEQEQSTYNGYFESTCFHPLLLFNAEGDCLAAKLRPGNVHSAEGWEELLLPEIERQQQMGKEVAFRGDAAFARPEVYEALEERGVKYAIRIPANDSLERDIAELLPRPVGRPSQKPSIEYKGFLYQAASWKTARHSDMWKLEGYRVHQNTRRKWRLLSVPVCVLHIIGRKPVVNLLIDNIPKADLN